MGLGVENKEEAVFLSIIDGAIWNKKEGKESPTYTEIEYTDREGNKKMRCGAKYVDFKGYIVGLRFLSHETYGDSISLKMCSGEDTYIFSVSLNNRYSQDLMKMLLVADLIKPVYLKPYCFTDKNKKVVKGISFKQDYAKLNLRIDDAPFKEGDWFKSATKKEIRRFFEDLTDWYVEKVKTKVLPKIEELNPEDVEKEKKEVNTPSAEEKGEEIVEEKKVTKRTVKKVSAEKTETLTPIKMKNFLKTYISENYPDETLPKLTKQEVIEWYNLAQQLEELPFQDDDEVSEEDLDEALNDLL